MSDEDLNNESGYTKELRWYNWFYEVPTKSHMYAHVKIRTFSKERAMELSENAKRKLEEHGFVLIKEECFVVTSDVDETTDIIMIVFGEENVIDAINFRW